MRRYGTGDRERGALAAVFSSSLGAGLIFGFQPPLIALILGRAGASSFSIGAVTAMTPVAVILLGPVYPRLITRLGPKHSVLAGMLLAMLLLALMAYWRGVPAWFALRFLTGCALGLSWIASEIWLNTVSSPESRGTVMGIYVTVFSLGTVAGPVLLEFTGTDGWAPFATGALCLGVTVVPLLLLPGAPVADAGKGVATRSFARCLRAAPIVMLAALVAGLVESADLALLPVFGLHSGLPERASLGLITVFLAGNVVLQLPIGQLADRFGRRRVLGLCAVVSGLGPTLLPALLPVPALLWPLLFLWGGTLYAFYSQGVALLGEAFTVEELAAANTVFVMIYCLGGVIGPTAGGLAMDAWMPRGLLLFLAGAPLLLLAGLSFRRPTTSP
jgi:MFS family permease